MIYVIGTPASTRVKVGFSADPQRRLTEIQRMSPVPLAILATWPGGQPMETELHRAMSDYHSYGEWFDFGIGVDAVSVVGYLANAIARSMIDRAIELGLVTTADELLHPAGLADPW